MEIQILHNKTPILSFLKKNTAVQIYCIGDLDEFFWSKTIWYGLVENNDILSIALLYTGMQTPTLLTFYENNANYAIELLKRIKSILPGKFLAHLSPNLIDVFGRKHVIAYYGIHYKMLLQKAPLTIVDENIRRLSVNELSLIRDLYAVAYPGNWFDERMMETEKYFGYFLDNKLVGLAGVHVYSAEFKVAALGNIATHPDYRGQQIANKLVSKLCAELNRSVNFIGLNVKSDNYAAIKCYKKIGFEVVGEYEECYLCFN